MKNFSEKRRQSQTLTCADVLSESFIHLHNYSVIRLLKSPNWIVQKDWCHGGLILFGDADHEHFRPQVVVQAEKEEGAVNVLMFDWDRFLRVLLSGLLEEQQEAAVYPLRNRFVI